MKKFCPHRGLGGTRRYALKKQWVLFGGRRIQRLRSLCSGAKWLRIRAQLHFSLTSLCHADLICKVGTAVVIVTGLF